MSPTRTVLLVSGLCVSTLTACLGGQVKDASTNASLSGVTVTAQNCDGCAVYTATTSNDGTYEFDAYAGDPVIFQDASVDAVKLVMYRPDFYGNPAKRLTHEAMRGPSEWSVGDRELMASFVSKANECEF